MSRQWDKKLNKYVWITADAGETKSITKTSIVNPGTPVRIALALEAVATFGFATYLLVFPGHAASQLATTPKYAGPLAETLLQFLAVISYGMSFAVAACIPNTPFSINLRTPVYVFLGATETFLIGLFAWLEYSKGQHVSGVSEPVASFMSWNFVAIVGWRLFVLTIMSEWLGSIEEVKKVE